MKRSYSGASTASTEAKEVENKVEVKQTEETVARNEVKEDAVKEQVEQSESVPEEPKPEEPNLYSELSERLGVSYGEMEVIAEYLKFTENKGDRMRAFSTFSLGSLLVSVFGFFALIMMILGKLPERFTSVKLGLILGGIILVALLILVFCVMQTIKYSKMEGFKDIGFIAPMNVIDVRKRENAIDQWCIQLQTTGETCWCETPFSYRTKIDVGGKMYKIKVNTHVKVGASGYYVSYSNRFGRKMGNFVIIA